MSFKGWNMVSIAVLMEFSVIGFTFYCYPLMFDSLEKELGATQAQLSGALSLFFICSAAASIFLGRLLDKYSVKNIMLIGGVIFSCGLISIAYVQSVFYLLLIYATFIAIGGPALGNLSVTKLVANWFETKAGVALGIAAIGISFSGVILPILVDPLISAIGWRNVYLVFASIVILILLPTVRAVVINTPEEILFADRIIALNEAQNKLKKQIKIHIILETAEGVMNVESLAACSPRLHGFSLGPADLAASRGMKTVRVGGSHPDYGILSDPKDKTTKRKFIQQDLWHYSLSKMIDACASNNIKAFFGPYGDFDDAEGCEIQFRNAFILGCHGAWSLHPSQIDIAKKVFCPSEDEVEKAAKIIKAMGDGTGAVKVDGKMQDEATVKQANVIIELAKKIASEFGKPLGKGKFNKQTPKSIEKRNHFFCGRATGSSEDPPCSQSRKPCDPEDWWCHYCPRRVLGTICKSGKGRVPYPRRSALDLFP